MAPSSNGEMNSQTKQPRYATWYDIASDSFISIEHPFIIRNAEKGVQTLGGASAISKLVRNTEDRPAARLYLKPGNRESKPTIARVVKTSDLVLKVTVPKRTGRKRKRGTDDPFEGSSNDISSHEASDKPTKAHSIPPSHLLRSLRDNKDSYKIEALGHIEETHRFRNLPDFVFSTKNNAFMQRLRDTTLTFEFEKLKNFEFDQSKGMKPTNDLIPPPRWNFISTPFNYSYRQNPSVKESLDPSGNPSFTVDGLPMKQYNQQTDCNAPTIPTHPSPLIPPLSSLAPALQRTITLAQELFLERPIWTRRALYNNLPEAEMKAIGWNGAKAIQQYCGYTFISGPWRDAIVRFGVDPRSDPEYRIYQTMQFQLETSSAKPPIPTPNNNPEKNPPPNNTRTSHIFTGETVSTDSKIWQIIDIHDPFLSSLFQSAPLRRTCHVTLDGWFQNGAYAKCRVMLKHKIRGILEGRVLGRAFFEVFQGLPDVLDERNRGAFTLGKEVMRRKVVGKEQVGMVSEMRTQALRSREVGEVVEEEEEEDGEEEDSSEDGEEDGDEDGEEEDGDEDGEEMEGIEINTGYV